MQFRLEPLTRFIKGSIIYHRDFWLVRSRSAFLSVGTFSPTLSTPPLPVAHPWVATLIQLKDDFLRAYQLISIPFSNTQGPIFNYTTSCRTSALDSFVKETTNEEIKSIIMEGRKFSYIVGDGLIIVISTNPLDNDVLIQDLLKDIKIKFLEKYKENLRNFSGNIDYFTNFDTELGELLTKSDISIKCRTCKKTIVGEFLRHLDNKKIYFCCPLCKENFLLANP